MRLRVCHIWFVVLLVATSALAVVNWDAIFKIFVRVPFLGWFIEYNVPPDDFYVPLGKIPLQTGITNLAFTCKYRGRHEIRIQGITSRALWESNVGMNIVVRGNSGDVFYSNVCTNSLVHGGANGDYNYCYAIFRAPDDVPLEEGLIATIVCHGDIENLMRHFPEAEVVVTKVFDK